MMTNLDPELLNEWRDSLEVVKKLQGDDAAKELITTLAGDAFINLSTLATDYINTIEPDAEPPYPGDIGLEARIRSIIRWNSAVMVLRANLKTPGIGGHLATYASAATLLEVGFNHFFKGESASGGGDQVFFQGHSSPGIYARAFFEGRIGEENLNNFRHEIGGIGLSSYPHPRLMPEFWQFATVSMGLGPLLAIYQAKFNRYLENRGLKDTSQQKIWCFVGDGELDEPEATTALHLAARESLDNLIFVVNCNLQRLDGPVRGNGKIIQDLEILFKAAGWNVIKVIWGSRWDPLIERDKNRLLVNRMGATLDGDYQRYSADDGSVIRNEFFGKDLSYLVENLTDDELRRLPRGGHDVKKIYAAYAAASNTKGQPSVILAKTVKGWDLGSHIEGRNASHAQKSMTHDDLIELRDRLKLGNLISNESLQNELPPYIVLSPTSKEARYVMERRSQLGGFLPKRRGYTQTLKSPEPSLFDEFYRGSGTLKYSTTSALARILRNLMRDKSIGKYIVPIVADEGRSFGFEPLFAEFGIYSSVGQHYNPVDKKLILNYREAVDGQLLEEGLTEAGAMASFVSSATSYSVHKVQTVPFYFFYSMFGFQRVGDLIWAASDMRSRGFLIGTTAGRTTYSGEGLQHEDGSSHVSALSVPSIKAYDPAFAYELAAIVEQGLKDILEERSDILYYITTYNENYEMPELQSDTLATDATKQNMVNGIYQFRQSLQSNAQSTQRASIWFSGPMWQSALKARDLLAESFNVNCDLWSMTSIKALRDEALAVERFNRLNPTSPKKTSFISQVSSQIHGPIVAVTDYVRAYPESLRPFINASFSTLGTDGFGRSDSRDNLRRFFEVDEYAIAIAVLERLGMTSSVETLLKHAKIHTNSEPPFSDR